ncbi:MAG: toxin-antitoxin system YwqK family antitoxin [Formosimonas sp.]
MKHVITISLIAASLQLAHAQPPVISQDATTTAKDLKVKCQTLEVAPNACVIAHFSLANNNWSLSQKPADVYRVLKGKTDDGLFVATDYYQNGHKQADAFASANASAILHSGDSEELGITAHGYAQYRPDGSKEYAVDMLNGVMTGTMTEYYPDGSRQALGQVKDGVHDGLWSYWYENGNKMSSGIEHQNHPAGEWTFWYDNGQKMAQGTYGEQGQTNGLWTYWYENGQKNSQGTYLNGAEHGEWVYWDETGLETNKTVYNAHSAVELTAAATPTVLDASDNDGFDAEDAALSLGTTCQEFIRKDQCVIAFFGNDDTSLSNSKNAKYYRVLYGKAKDMYIIQDFYRTGQRQSNVFFSRSKAGILQSLSDELNAESRVIGYTPESEPALIPAAENTTAHAGNTVVQLKW